MLCSPESLSDTVLQWRVSCAKDGMKAMGETCEELGGMFKTSARIVPRSWRGPTCQPCQMDQGFGGSTAPFFLGFQCHALLSGLIPVVRVQQGSKLSIISRTLKKPNALAGVTAFRKAGFLGSGS